MARLTTARARVAVLLPAFVAVGCPSHRAEGPPPAESLEVVSAAPGALGALAGGTDAAPPVVQPTPEEALEGDEEPTPGVDAGAPEAGVEAPENVPL
jgi:hypothetical protein